MEKIKNWIVKIFFVVLFLIFVTILLCNLFYNKTIVNEITFIRVLLGIIIYGCLVFLFYFLYKKIKNKKHFTIVYFILFFIFQCFFSYVFEVIPSWDYGIVFTAAKNSIIGSKNMLDSWYFYMYPNNIGLGLFYKIIFSIFKLLRLNSGAYLDGLVVVNILAIDISIVFMYKTLKTCIDKDISMFLLMCTMIITPFVTYCPIAYSDTVSMPFIISSLYYFVLYFIKGEESKKNIVLSSLLLGIGSCIKFSSAILLVAYIIYIIFINKDILKKILYIVVICLLFFTMYFPIRFSEYVYLKPDVLEKKKMPITHWIMMGLHEDDISVGGFYEEDAKYTLSFENGKEKREKNVEMIKRRLHNYSSNNDLLGFYLRKLTYVWGDGTFYARNKLWLRTIRDYSFKKYIIGSHYRTVTYRLYAQSQWMIVLFFTAIALLFNKYLKDDQRKLLFINSITITGVIIFFLLWEARSRYLINFLPIILINCSLGVISIKNKLDNKKVQ